MTLNRHQREAMEMHRAGPRATEERITRDLIRRLMRKEIATSVLTWMDQVEQARAASTYEARWLALRQIAESEKAGRAQ